MSNNQILVDKFNRIKADKSLADDEKNLKLNEISDELIKSTIDCYDNTATLYGDLRAEVGGWNTLLWSVFEYGIEVFENGRRALKVLDIGASVGRELIHGQKLGYDMYGVELSNGFLVLLDKLYADGKIKNKVKKCDMRALDYSDNFFDAVSHVATLLHMPVIGKGYTADKALEETNRILKTGGIVYVVVKEGSPELKIHNTGEGLGSRVFQFFSMESLCEVIKRNGFEILLANKLQEIRPKETVDTLAVVARKV